MSIAGDTVSWNRIRQHKNILWQRHNFAAMSTVQQLRR